MLPFQQKSIYFSQNGFTSPSGSQISIDEIILKISNKDTNESKLIYDVRNLIFEVGKEGAEDELKLVKSKLSCFSFCNYKNNYRSNENFIESYGMILDFDNLYSATELKSKIAKDERVFCSFISPSFFGLKVILLFDEVITNQEHYKNVYKHCLNIFSKEYEIQADNTFDPARACLISYDDKIYVNYECKRLNTKNLFNETPTFPKVQRQNFNEPILNKFIGVKAGERNTTLTSLVGVCIKKGFNEDISHMLAKEWNNQNQPPLGEDEIKSTVKNLYKRYHDDIELFIYYTDGDKLGFNYFQYINFLGKIGYYKFRLNESYIVVKEENAILDIVSTEMIKEDVLKRVDDVQKKRYLIEKESSIFSDGKLDFLAAFETQLNEDSKDNCTIYFKNGFIEVTKNEISNLQTWDRLKKPIWKSSILQRECELLTNQNEIAECVFSRFLKNISGNDQTRYKSIVTSLGYLCHSYFDPSDRRAIVFYDETPPEMEGEAQGGKGKSLVVQALRHFIINHAWIGGTNLKQITQFTFQCVSPDTKLVCIDDLVGKFDFSSMFASVTEGLTVEKKYQDSFVVKNVKFILTSNFTLAGDGSSFERRIFEIEIAPHYSLTRRPIDDFGHRLFEDWDNVEWNRFDNFMLWCIREYLGKGLVTYPKINVALKKLIESTDILFYEYCKTLEIGTIYYSDFEFRKFTTQYQSGHLRLTKTKFTQWLKKYAQCMNYNYIEKRGTGNLNNGFIFEKRSLNLNSLRPIN